MLFGLRASRLGLALCSCALFLVSGPALGSVESELAFHRGVIAFGEDEYDEAERQFQIVLKEDPEDTVSLHYLGLNHYGVLEGRLEARLPRSEEEASTEEQVEEGLEEAAAETRGQREREAEEAERRRREGRAQNDGAQHDG